MVVGGIAVLLLVLAFWWGGWAGEAAFVLGTVILMIDGLVALVCQVRRDAGVATRRWVGVVPYLTTGWRWPC